jgi:hypothetical protein
VISEADARLAITLAGQGMAVSQIARRVGHDRKTIRIYLDGHRAPGQHRADAADTYAPFAAYILQRAGDDVHLRTSGLHREIAALGYAGSYPAFTRQLRDLDVSAACTRHCRPPQLARVAVSLQPSAPLPVRVAPITGETVSSYLSRVAAAAHLPLTTITAVLPRWFAVRTVACDDIGTARPGRFQPGYVSHLATLTGITETTLSHALPALARHRGGARPPLRSAFACHRCAAGHGQAGLVPVHLPAWQRVCQHHRIWLGRAAQINLTAVPDVTAAGSRASRLARQYGTTTFVLAETTARQDAIGGPAALRRAPALALASPRPDPGHPDMAEAAAYPETVQAAAALLRTPGALPAGPG